MIKEFQIEGFKKFSNLKLENLGQINIFLGQNNVGKTTFLESLIAFACGEMVSYIVGTSFMRVKDIVGPYDFADKLLSGFYHKNSAPFQFTVSAKDYEGVTHSFEHKLMPGPVFAELRPSLMEGIASTKGSAIMNQQINMTGGVFTQSNPQTFIGDWTSRYNGNREKNISINYPVGFIGEPVKQFCNARHVDILDHRDETENRKIYAALKRENKMDSFIKELSIAFPEVQNIETLPYPDGTNGPVSVDTKHGLIPLNNFGDGLQRYFNVLGGLYLNQNGIHCIEEVDATFHPEAQELFSKNLFSNASVTNNQIFMSSHSAEFVDNFLKSISDLEGNSGLEAIRVYTLRNMNDKEVRVRMLTGVEALIRRNEYEMELR